MPAHPDRVRRHYGTGVTERGMSYSKLQVAAIEAAKGLGVDVRLMPIQQTLNVFVGYASGTPESPLWARIFREQLADASVMKGETVNVDSPERLPVWLHRDLYTVAADYSV